MKVHTVLWSALAASSVLLVAGAAFSGDPAKTTQNVLVKYDARNHQLSGVPQGASEATLYLHDENTVHLSADITAFAPPDPCVPMVDAWNATVEYDTRSGATSSFIFDVLLTFMSDMRCGAEVTSIAGSPEPMLAITPVVVH